MLDEEWIKALADGRRVQFTYQKLPDDGAFITAQIERNRVVYSILLAKAKNPLSREEVESHSRVSCQRSSNRTITLAGSRLVETPAMEAGIAGHV